MRIKGSSTYVRIEDFEGKNMKVVTYRVKGGTELPIVKGPVGPKIDLNAINTYQAVGSYDKLKGGVNY